MPGFDRYIGIDYSGAETPNASLKGLRVYLATGDAPASEVLPPPSPRKYWTRRGIAEWLVERLAEDVPTLVGIDHGFSFPLRYFEVHGLPPDWPRFLDDFQRHWPTDDDHTYVDFVRDGMRGRRRGTHGQRPLAAHGRGTCRGQVGVPLRRAGLGGEIHPCRHPLAALSCASSLGSRLHFWPFDGWDIPAGHSAVAEVYPALWKHAYAPEDRTPDQHDAYTVATWLRQADRDGRLQDALQPNLSPPERGIAEVEGWILGVG